MNNHCTDVLSGAVQHPCVRRGEHRVHACDCDLGLHWIRNPDDTVDITGHLHRTPLTTVSHTVPVTDAGVTT